MAPYIKMFRNGIKAVLREQNGRTPGVLRLFDKDNCLIAERQILQRGIPEVGGRSLEKLTVQANKIAGDPKDIELLQGYKARYFDKNRKLMGGWEDETEHGFTLSLPGFNDNPVVGGLGWKERMSFAEKGGSASSKKLWKMLKQWCDFRREDTLREIPKPIKFKGMNA